jgi:transposase
MTKQKSGKKEKRKAAVPTSLPVVRPKVAGIDVGSTQHWVCGPARGDCEPNVHVFGTTTDQLNALADWLVEQGVESVAMESTYIYWIPIYELLESRGLEVVLVNARQLHNVPGRKTDFSDCQWLQLLHSCGLLRGSFRPDEAITRMRAMQRQMANLVQERTRCVQWMQKALDQMNVQVHRAVAEITGTTGMAIVRAIVAGERDPARLAMHRDRRCHKSVTEIARYLTGTWRDEHLFNLASALRLYDAIEQEIASYDARLLKELEAIQPPDRRGLSVPSHPSASKQRAIRARGDQPLRTTLWRFAGVDLTRIDGVSAGVAQVVLTEVGPDVSAFPSEHDFVSWLRLCPRTPISGGKPIKKRRNGLGANRISAVLRMAATSLRRSKSAIGASFRRIARYKGAAVAVFASARKLAQLIYRMLRFGQDYVDIGEQAYERQFQLRRLASLNESAKSLGFHLLPLASTQDGAVR